MGRGSAITTAAPPLQLLPPTLTIINASKKILSNSPKLSSHVCVCRIYRPIYFYLDWNSQTNRLLYPYLSSQTTKPQFHYRESETSRSIPSIESSSLFLNWNPRLIINPSYITFQLNRHPAHHPLPKPPPSLYNISKRTSSDNYAHKIHTYVHNLQHTQIGESRWLSFECTANSSGELRAFVQW